MERDESGNSPPNAKLRAYKHWSASEIGILKAMADKGVSGREAAHHLGRSAGAIQQKAALLALHFNWTTKAGGTSCAGRGAVCPARDGRASGAINSR